MMASVTEPRRSSAANERYEFPELKYPAWEAAIGPAERHLATRFPPLRDVGTAPCLLQVDFYRKAFGGRGRAIPEVWDDFPSSAGNAAWEALGPAQRLLAAHRGRDVPVIHATLASVGGTPFVTRRLRPPEDDAWGLEFQDGLGPLPTEIVIEKHKASVAYGTPLISLLTQARIDTVVISGQSRSGCVRATAVDLFSAGFSVVIPQEATFDKCELSGQISLFDLNLKYAVVTDVAAVEEYLASVELPGDGVPA